MTDAPSLCVRRVAGCLRGRRSVPLVLAAVLYLAPMRRARGEERLDFKTLIYQEDDNRIQVIAPCILMEKDLSPSLTLRVDGVYNAISGASPTGAPAYQQVTETITVTTPSAAPSGPSVTVSAPSSSPVVVEDVEREDEYEGEDEGDDDDEREGGYAAAKKRGYTVVSGATPQSQPAPQPAPAPAPAPTSSSSSSSSPSSTSSRSKPAAPTTTTRSVTKTVPGGKVPKSQVDDTRLSFNVELIKRLGRHTPSVMLSHSSEEDYESWGVAMRDAIDFNQKNTTLLLGASVNADQVEGAWVLGAQDKTTYDGLVGLTQVLDRKTLFTVNVSAGKADGYLNDPYKVVELNGELVGEQRPDSKDKVAVYLAINRYVENLRGSAELSYRYYDDSFGIRADTVGLAWYQKVGEHWTVRPAVRVYQQSAADFYAVSFTGSPDYYSADYRLSEFMALGYGLKVIWAPTDRLAFDVSYDRYEQDGQDGVTPEDAYPQANAIMVGCRIWL